MQLLKPNISGLYNNIARNYILSSVNEDEQHCDVNCLKRTSLFFFDFRYTLNVMGIIMSSFHSPFLLNINAKMNCAFMISKD